MYQYGIVASVDPEECTARVHFEAYDDLVSKPLPIMQLGTRTDAAYWLPDVGEQVACLMDENAEEGVILGALYNEEDTPGAPTKAPGERSLIIRKAGAEVYRFAVSRDNDGAAELVTKGPLTAETQAGVDVTCGGLFTVEAGGKLKLAGNGEDLGAVITEIWAKFVAHKHVCATAGQPTPTFYPPTAPVTDYAPISQSIANLFQ